MAQSSHSDPCPGLVAASMTPDALDVCRPPAGDTAHLAHALAMLPRKGEVTRFDNEGRSKLESLREFTRRLHRDGAWEIKIVKAPQAAIGLFERSVLIVTEPAFHLLSSVELHAMLAHESGHEYVWRQYEDARAAKQQRRLQELELVCDRVAVFTLARFGIDTRHLTRGLRKVHAYNLERLGEASNAANYPYLDTRTALIVEWSN